MSKRVILNRSNISGLGNNLLATPPQGTYEDTHLVQD